MLEVQQRMTETENRAEFITFLIEGNNAMVHGDYDAAISAYEKALVLNPKFAMTCSKLGLAYYQKKDYDESIKYYKLALELDPKQTETLYRLGKAYGDSGMMIQAAVAFDMARERDATGDLQERIDNTERRIRKRSKHGSVRRVSAAELVKSTTVLLFSHLLLFVPAVIAVAVLAGSEFLMRWLLTDIFKLGAPVIDFTKYLFTAAPKLSPSTMIYLGSQVVVYCFICVPILGVETALVGRLVSGREATFDEAISRSFGQISSLAGVSLLLLIIGGATSIVSSKIFEGFTIMFRDFFRFFFDLRVFVLPVTVLVMIHFTYIYPSIIIDRRKMESGLKKSIAFANKFFWFTFILIAANLAVQFWSVYYGGLELTPKFFLARFALMLMQAFFIAAIAVAYSKGFRGRHKKHDKKSMENTGEKAEEGVEIERAELSRPAGEYIGDVDEEFI